MPSAAAGNEAAFIFIGFPRHIRTSPLVRLKSNLEWATALDDQGYPVLNMPQAEYQKMLDNPVSVHDLHATILHQLGLDHEALTYRFGGRDFTLPDVEGRVNHELILS